MKYYKSKTYPLKWLTGITVVVLVGIIALQVYWLATSYTEQKSRFTADIENAIIATIIQVQVEQNLHNVGNNALDLLNTSGLSDAVSKVINNIPKDVLANEKNARKVVTINLTDTNMKAADMAKLVTALQQKMADTGKPINTTLGKRPTADKNISKKEFEQYKNIFKIELEKRKIKAPFELALVDSSQHIYMATCDTQTFRKIPIKSSANDIINYIAANGCGLQAAFPEANLYLVRRMAWILSVTGLLLVIGSLSLTYLLVLFFRQKKLSDIRNDFMNNMTHELKTPISSVAVALEMVLDRRYDMNEDKKKQYLYIAQGELKRLNMLVENVLKISLFERSEIRIIKEPIVVMPWLLDIESSLRPVLERKAAQLTLNVRPELLAISADKTHFTNVMQNLIENALKYNDKEVPKINIDIREEGENIHIAVTDNGKGIPAKYVDKVFDKFFRVPSGDRHDIKGYGLGLSYVKAVVELHDGIVSAQSNFGEGSTFILILPVKK